MKGNWKGESDLWAGLSMDPSPCYSFEKLASLRARSTPQTSVVNYACLAAGLRNYVRIGVIMAT
jgi:hypothetical protein